MRSDELDALLVESRTVARGYFRRRCAVAQDVDDLVQECVAAVLASRHRFAGRSSTRTWITAICRNLWGHHLYYASRAAAVARRLEQAAQVEQLPADEADETRAGVRSVLASFPAPERLLYRLAYVEGRSVAEIARILGRPPGTVKYLLYELRRHVRAALARDGFYRAG